MKYEVLNKYGLKNGNIVFIDDVPSGLACKTFCASCNSSFVAKKGKKQHHFAHYQNPDCGSSLESALHILAKEIIKNSKTIKVPSQFGIKELEIESCELEKNVSDIRPDILLKLNDKTTLFIEITVTNKISIEKEKRIKKIGVPTLDIIFTRSDASKNIKEIKQLVLEEVQNKKWVLYPEGYKRKIKTQPPRIPLGMIPLWSKHYEKQQILYKKLTSDFFKKYSKWQEQEYFEKQLQDLLNAEKSERLEKKAKTEERNYFKGRHIERKYGTKF